MVRPKTKPKVVPTTTSIRATRDRINSMIISSIRTIRRKVMVRINSMVRSKVALTRHLMAPIAAI